MISVELATLAADDLDLAGPTMPCTEPSRTAATWWHG
jgi:hypothetical protein